MSIAEEHRTLYRIEYAKVKVVSVRNGALMPDKLDSFIRHSLAVQPLSGTSLIISLYGDALSQRGGEVWLGSLSALLAPLGFSDRWVRTAVFRLQKEGWLEAEKAGRRSYYRLSEHGLQQFRHAESKIYQGEPALWNGEWDLLLLEGVEKTVRARLRQSLGWLGFGQLSTTLLAAPADIRRDVTALLSELPGGENTIWFRAQSAGERSAGCLKRQVANNWALDEMAAHYQQFIDAWRPLMLLLRDRQQQVSEQQAFELCLLLIHAWRRVVLRDPQLPDALLPPQWPGHTARHLCINLYRRLALPATRRVSQLAESRIGELPQPCAAFYQRFGGLESVGHQQATA